MVEGEYRLLKRVVNLKVALPGIQWLAYGE